MSTHTDPAACGLACGDCDICRAAEDPKLAARLAAHFTRETGKPVAAEEIVCLGCLGPRDKHWSAECWILTCCVDDKGLSSCSACSDFPCQRLEEWGRSRATYGKALGRLRSMSAG